MDALFSVLAQTAVGDSGLKAIGAGPSRSASAPSALASASVCWSPARWRLWAATREAENAIRTNMILGIAFAEAIAIYALIVAVIIAFVL